MPRIWAPLYIIRGNDVQRCDEADNLIHWCCREAAYGSAALIAGLSSCSSKTGACGVQEAAAAEAAAQGRRTAAAEDRARLAEERLAAALERAQLAEARPLRPNPRCGAAGLLSGAACKRALLSLSGPLPGSTRLMRQLPAWFPLREVQGLLQLPLGPKQAAGAVQLHTSAEAVDLSGQRHAGGACLLCAALDRPNRAAAISPAREPRAGSPFSYESGRPAGPSSRNVNHLSIGVP